MLVLSAIVWGLKEFLDPPKKQSTAHKPQKPNPKDLEHQKLEKEIERLEAEGKLGSE